MHYTCNMNGTQYILKRLIKGKYHKTDYYKIRNENKKNTCSRIYIKLNFLSKT